MFGVASSMALFPLTPLLLLPLSSYPLFAAAAHSGDRTLGVSPSLLSQYVPNKVGNWKCLDGSKEIPWHFVNDDSCDCPDGSDEPGTSACPNNIFYCKNEGHIGATIPSSRVNDGLCEPECCDGSDEAPGTCPNACKAIGDEHRKKIEAQNKLRKTGSKIRSSYITFAHKEKKRLEALIETLGFEIDSARLEVDELQEVVDRQESISAAALEHKKESPLYQTLLEHKSALKSLQREYKAHLAKEKELADILDALRSNYNPNYQDMAVLEAVRGYEAFANLPHIGVEADAAASGEEAKEEEKPAVVVKTSTDDEDAETVSPEEDWTEEELEKDLDTLLKVDTVELLLEHDEHIGAGSAAVSPLFDLASYLPDSVVPSYLDFKDTLVSGLSLLGIVSAPSGVSLENSKARTALTKAQDELSAMEKKLENAKNDVKEIFNIHGFGAEGEWKKLDGTCLEKDEGDYIYEVCLFKEAKQKPKNGGQTFDLGKFESWNPSPDVQAGQPEYYQHQAYKKGTKCWNGPERSVQLILSCGTDNALLSVEELEKCEYQFKGTTPALCYPLENGEEKGKGKDEL